MAPSEVVVVPINVPWLTVMLPTNVFWPDNVMIPAPVLMIGVEPRPWVRRLPEIVKSDPAVPRATSNVVPPVRLPHNVKIGALMRAVVAPGLITLTVAVAAPLL